jgi:hypothetical protein
MICAFRIYSPPVAKMRNASPGPGFLGKTSRVLTGWYSSIVLLSFVESDIPDVTRPLFREELLSQDNIKLNIKGIVRLKVSQRILVAVMVFKINILELI